MVGGSELSVSKKTQIRAESPIGPISRSRMERSTPFVSLILPDSPREAQAVLG